MSVRILHVGKFFPPYAGGMEVFLADLVQAQRAAGHEVEVLAHGAPRPDDPPWLTRVPVWKQLLYVPLAPGFPRALWRRLRVFRPDVLHLHLPNPSAFAALLLPSARRIPWVVHWHSDVVSAPGHRALAAAYRLYRPFEQALLARAARVLVTSPRYLDASEPLARWRDRCAVVPLGLDPARYPERPPGRAEWSEGLLRVLAVGRLSHYKGFPVLVRAVAELPGVELCIAGDGEQRAELDTLARAAGGRVRLLGAVDEADKHALLASCDVLCLPSVERSEAFGVVLLEAMRYARPLLVSDLSGSGVPWVVERSGAGWRVPPGDVAAWRAALQDLRDDPGALTRCGRAGADALLREFSIEACARAVAAQYRLAGCADTVAAVRRGLLVVIPARNEAATIGSVVGGLRAAGFGDVVVVDDHSSDGTGALAAQAGARVLRPVLPLRAWGAMQTGIRYAIAEGYEAVVTMDADGQHEVAEIPALLAARDHGDVVVGAHPARVSPLRRIAWEWFRRLSGLTVEDLTSGFRCYGPRAMRVAVGDGATLLDFQDVGVLLLLRRSGLRVVEVPVAMSPRVADKSRVFNSWFTVARYMAATTLLCLSRGRR